jgi:O-antigen/teichoic acid export membrane protein
MNSPPGSLIERSLRAVKWNYLGTVGRVLAQFVSLVVLARLLGPEPTGLFGYALLSISFVSLATDMGLSAALVQTTTLSRAQLGGAVTRLVFVAVIVSGLLYVSAEWIATSLFSTPQATPVLKAIAPGLIVSALSIPPTSMLRRELHFRALTLITLGSYILGYVFVGIGVALAGGGVWSLVAAWYAQNVATCIATNIVARNSLAWGNPLRLHGLGGFGAIIMATYLFNWVIDNATHFVTGRVLGPVALGAFSVANNLVRTPANHLVISLQTVLFPASARAVNNPAALRRAYLTTLSGVGLVALPLFSGAAAASTLVVDALLGAKWTVAQPLLTPLALAMIPHSLMAICGPILGGKGVPVAELKVQAAIALLLVVTLLVASPYSLENLAWTLCGIFLLRFLWITHELARRIGVSAADITGALRGGLFLALVTAAAVGAINFALATEAAMLPPIIRLGIAIISVTVLCAILLIGLPRLCLDGHLSWLVTRLLGNQAWANRLPFMRRFLAHVASASTP